MAGVRGWRKISDGKQLVVWRHASGTLFVFAERDTVLRDWTVAATERDPRHRLFMVPYQALTIAHTKSRASAIKIAARWMSRRPTLIFKKGRLV